jgi:Family of unknown function (DUF5872)
MPTPLNKKLYEVVKKEADKKFLASTSIYKSSWIVSEYKRRGGTYEGEPTKKKGLRRWFAEKWVDLNRPIKDSSGKIIDYEPCGREDMLSKEYPLCRPTYVVTDETPRTYSEITPKDIENAKREKQKIKHKGNIKFGGNSSKNFYIFAIIILKLILIFYLYTRTTEDNFISSTINLVKSKYKYNDRNHHFATVFSHQPHCISYHDPMIS